MSAAKKPSADEPMPWMPMNGSTSNAGVWSMIVNSATSGTPTPPTVTVSRPRRTVST